MLAAIHEFGFASLGLRTADLLDAEVVVQLGRAPNRIDLLTSLTGLEFDASYARHESVGLGGLTIPVIAFDDLLANKKATGRPKDLLDVVALSAAPPS